jgi:hypothetical protein
MSDATNPQRTAKSSNPTDACRASLSQTRTQPVVLLSWQHRDTTAPPSLNRAELFRQNDTPSKPWSIHAIGDAVTLCHNVDCIPCVEYAQHLFCHTGTFGLPPEWVQEVVSKAWPCLIETMQQEVKRPLKERLAGLEHYTQAKQEWYTNVDNVYEDLQVRHEDLKELCKALVWALKAKERECHNWAAKACHLDSCLNDLVAQGP